MRVRVRVRVGVRVRVRVRVRVWSIYEMASRPAVLMEYNTSGVRWLAFIPIPIPIPQYPNTPILRYPNTLYSNIPIP